jgi:alpha-2-macroglobulin
MPKGEHGQRDYHYWGSTDRDRAQALLALVKLRPASKLATVLAHRLIRGVDRYTTQSTAWSLMALSAFVGGEKPNGSVDVKIRVEGIVFDTTRSLGGDNKEVTFALKDLRGKKLRLILQGDGKAPSAFSLETRYVLPDKSSKHHARRTVLGPSVYRVFTDPRGAPVDLANVKAGDVVRVVLRIELPKLDTWRATYLAVTDRLAAGFQPVQPDLATVAQAPDLQKEHPFYEGLTGWGGSASYVDVRDDRVNVYFDRIYGNSTAYATYLMRATTPGEFVLPAAHGELMYEPGSEGYSDGGRVTIR